jgi:hypothetical protein
MSVPAKDHGGRHVKARSIADLRTYPAPLRVRGSGEPGAGPGSPEGGVSG